MDCPKCGHQQADTIKCASCGIYFAKFAEQQARLASRPRERMQHAPPEAGFGWGAITLTAIVSVVLVWGLMRGRTPAGAATTGPARPAAELTPRRPQAPPPSAVAPPAAPPRGAHGAL